MYFDSMRLDIYMTIKKHAVKNVTDYFESIATLRTLKSKVNIVEETIQRHRVLNINAHE